MLSFARWLTLILLVALSKANTAPLTQSPIPGVICHRIADIIFVFDESESISPTDFTNSKNFISVLIALLDVDDKKMVRVGVVSFATLPTVEIRIADYVDKNELLVTKVPAITQTIGGTHTASGLHTAWAELVWGLTNNNPRDPIQIPLASVHRVIMLFSDGLPTQSFLNPPDATKSQTTIIAQRIKDGTWSGMLPTTDLDTDPNLAPVGNSQLQYPVFIFSVFLTHLDADAPYMMSLSSGANWFITLVNPDSFNDPQLTNTCVQIVRDICFTETPTPSPTNVPGGQTPTDPTVGGDIHFTTLDNVMFTFNGAGDYVYATTPKIFDLHIRAAMLGKATTLAAIAIRDHDSRSITELWWNGIGADEIVLNVRYENDKNNTVIPLNKGVQNVGPFIMNNSDKKGMLTLQHEKNDEFLITCFYHGQASFDAKIPKEWETYGLGGNNNDNPEDDMCDRKGRCLNLKETQTNRDVHNYALDWKVLPDELVFERWMSVSDYELQYHPISLTYEKLNEAYQICGKVQPCIFDFINVGRKDYAKLTKQKFEGKFESANPAYYYVGDHL